jgi:hypothetical protein
MSTSWLLWSFALLFLIGGPILVYGFTQANRLVRAEHDLHPDAWERDGFKRSGRSGLSWTVGFVFLAVSDSSLLKHTARRILAKAEMPYPNWRRL